MCSVVLEIYLSKYTHKSIFRSHFNHNSVCHIGIRHRQVCVHNTLLCHIIFVMLSVEMKYSHSLTLEFYVKLNHVA